ncbi:hypothetical protein ABTZ57_43555 [Streptomyces sp. NPDC094048]|uniref:hypothetical protein n=1 Tax=unclassified Streptomyces TaxID=2593676 RepID=UPI003328FC55
MIEGSTTSPAFDASRDPRRSPNASLIGVPGGARRLATPALIIDLPVLRANLIDMSRRCAEAGTTPHGKTHKSVALAQEQIAAGAVGICATTGREAIVFAQARIPGLLVTTPIVQPAHIDALAALHRDGADITLGPRLGGEPGSVGSRPGGVPLCPSSSSRCRF